MERIQKIIQEFAKYDYSAVNCTPIIQTLPQFFKFAKFNEKDLRKRIYIFQPSGKLFDYFHHESNAQHCDIFLLLPKQLYNFKKEYDVERGIKSFVNGFDSNFECSICCEKYEKTDYKR